LNTVVTPLMKVFVRVFYQENASFFLFVVGVAGGFMRDVEHIALAQFFIGKAYLIAIPASLWVIYGIKIINFNKTVLTRPENQFLFHLVLFPKAQRWTLTAIVAFFQFIPAILYGVFLILFAAEQNSYEIILVIAASLVLILLCIIKMLNHTLHHSGRETKLDLLARLTNRFVKLYPVFIIEWIGRRYLLVLAVTKIVSCVFLFGVLRLYVSEAYDSRLLGMAIVIVTVMGTQLIFEIHRFDNYHFTIIRQLPVLLAKRISYVAVCLVFLSMPETGIIITYFPDNLSFINLITALFFAFSCQFFIYCLMYRKPIDQERLMKVAFIFSVTWILLILFKVPLLLVATLNTGLATYWYNRFYFDFENISEKV
jgi:hypothetical protein